MASEGSDLELRAHKVCAPASATLEAVLHRLGKVGVDIFYAIRCRPKSIVRTIEKVKRKRADEKKETYEPESVTDIAGMRIITLFREDVIEALRIFLQLINHEGPFETLNPFVKRGLREGIIYTTAPVGDPEAITSRLLGVFSSMGHPILDENVRQEKTRYSSIHLVADVQIAFDGQPRIVPVEIQIRTVFEDAWSEIDHKLRYSLNRAKSTAELENWQPHLNVLKTFVDGCGQYAGVIKSQAIDPSLKPRFEMAPFKPVENATEALALMGEIPDSLKDAFLQAYDLRANAIKLGDAAEAKALLLEAAEKFKAISSQLHPEAFKTKEGAAAANFLASMEQAFCLLSTKDKAALDRAVNIYAIMQEQSPQSVIVYYRYAQALFQLNEFAASEKMFARADELLGEDRFVPEGHWLHIAVPMQWSYCLWTQSLAHSDSGEALQERLTLLRKAYVLTQKALKLAKPGSLRETRLTNNLLYYGAEFCGLWKEASQIDPIQRDELIALLDVLEKRVVVATATKKQLSWMDTLCRAYVQFDMREKAVAAAERIEHVLGPARPETATPMWFSTLGKLNDRERDIFEHSLWVLRQYGPGPDREEPVGEA